MINTGKLNRDKIPNDTYYCNINGVRATMRVENGKYILEASTCNITYCNPEKGCSNVIGLHIFIL